MNGAMRSLHFFVLLGLTPGKRAQDVIGLYVTGDCNNDTSDHNGYWHSLGQTASGHYFFKHTEQEYYIYFDPYCDGNPGTAARWIMDSDSPSTSAAGDLDNDGTCYYHGRYNTEGTNPVPPSAIWRSWCVDTAWTDSDVTITQVEVTSTSTTPTTSSTSSTSATSSSSLSSTSSSTASSSSTSSATISTSSATTSSTSLSSTSSTTTDTSTTRTTSRTITLSTTTLSTTASSTTTLSTTTSSTSSSSTSSTGTYTTSVTSTTLTSTTLTSQTVTSTSVSLSSTSSSVSTSSTFTTSTSASTSTSTDTSTSITTSFTLSSSTSTSSSTFTSVTTSSSTFTSTSRSNTSTSISSTSTRTSTSTKTSSTTTMVAAAPVEVADTALGDALTESLNVAMLMKEGDDTATQSLESGNVTVMKFAAANSTATTLLQHNSTWAIAVPPTLFQNWTEGRSVMMVVTELNDGVQVTLPTSTSNDGESVVFSSPVLEVSFVEEAFSQVTVLEVSGLTDPIIFRISDQDPVSGDTCAYFDTQNWVWSTEGTAMLSAAQLSDLEAELSQTFDGTWCAATHLSLFAVIQTVPFDQSLASGITVLANTYVTAVAIVGGFLGCMLCICIIYVRVLHPPSMGAATLKFKGQSRPVTFTCSEVTQVTGVGTEGTEGAEARTKGLVQWHFKPESIMPHLKSLQGIRNVRTQSSTTPREVLQDSDKRLVGLSRSASLASRAGSRAPPEHIQAVPDETPFDAATDEVILDLDAMLPGPICEAYADGESVLYCSTVHQQMVCATILGSGVGALDPCYDCRLVRGPWHQRRAEVPLRLLRPTLTPGIPVMAFAKGSWRPAHVTKLNPSQGKCQVDVDDYQGELRKTLFELPLLQVRRRFWQGQSCAFYRGKEVGWVSCTITEDVVEDMPTGQGASTLVSPHLSPDPETSKAGCPMASVLLAGSDDVLLAPTYLLKTDHSFSSMSV
ncbi:unnamed protein product [Effrenium voratum]|nr:unnamed protein product [Effrenium voratum]